MKATGWFALLMVILALAGTGAGLVRLAGQQPPANPGGQPGVGIVRIDGYIAAGETVQRAVEPLDALSRDARVKGLIVQVNSIGGDAAGVELIAGKLRDCRQRNVPVVLAVDGALFGEAFRLLSAANRALASSPSLFGRLPPPAPTASSPTAGESVEGAGEPGLAPAVEPALPQLLADLAAARDLDRAQLAGFAGEGVVSAAGALAARVIDEIGGRDAALSACGELAQLGPSPRIILAGQASAGEQFTARLNRLFDRVRPDIHQQGRDQEARQ